MSTNQRGWKRIPSGFVRRLTSLVLAAVMLWSLIPALTPPAAAAEWMESYLETLVDWGVMRGSSSGDLNPDRRLSRAEFVTMINRAFGYTKKGVMPFTDVPENAWYADDFNIAYNAGYFTGSTETTASPNGWVTREQAAVLLGRNLRLQGVPGVNSDFKDVQQMGNWSRSYVQECAELGIIQGYQDGTFRPKNVITRGQMACFLVRALGTLVHETGDQIAGGVYGNLTVNTSGVRLKDTVVTGNLYLSGGVGLGSVELENVTVMGKIVVCGAGEAERGKSSIILRNVTAEAMEIDSLTGDFMTVRAEGLTNIASTTVRTSAYLEDLTEDDQGLREIILDGTEDGTKLQLAGNIKEVVNITPNSDLQVVQGVTDKLTVDERAEGSALSIANDTTVRILNLDAGVPVTGNGDVSKMNINAAGSTASMLPDSIYVRPGINANINGEVMDTTAADESSDEPRLLAGYPLARNIASTSADAVFSTNKRGTLYWAVSALLDGSLKEDELRDPSSHKGKVLRSGTINVTASKTEMTARITGLAQEGSYYISAMLVDARGHASPVKVTAFTTTDDSVPAFAAGYPEALVYVTDDNEQIVQARVMTTKTCQLYYALLPQNSTAPTPESLRSGAVTGNLGYGVMTVRKNSPYTIPRVNTAYLQEKTTYDLYLWLNDADNNKSSAVRRLQVTTKDVTPPVIQRLEPTDMRANTITMTYSLNEPGTLYWAIVKRGQPFLSSDIEEVGTPPNRVNNEIAKMQIKRHLGVRGGSSNAARENTDVSFTISGLEPQTTYDLYYVAEDRDGNFNVYTATLTPPMQVNTLDEVGPDVEQVFTHDGDSNPQHPTPYTDTSIRLVFTEEVQGIDSTSNQDPSRFLDLYQAGNTTALATALAKHIRLYYKPALDLPILLTDQNQPYGSIDFTKARVELDTSDGESYGQMVITFPQEGGGLKLASGATYYFELEGIWDVAKPKVNQLVGTQNGIRTLPEFTTLFATVRLARTAQDKISVYDAYGSAPTKYVEVARSFTATPSGTESVSEETRWDMLFWTDTSMSYTLYFRERARTGENSWGAWSNWQEAGNNSTVTASVIGAPGGRVYASLFGYVRNNGGSIRGGIPMLKNLSNQYEFAIALNEVNAPADAESINMEITVMAGDLDAIGSIAEQEDHGWKPVVDDAVKNYGAVQISIPVPYEIPIAIPGKAPAIEDPDPYIDVGDVGGTIHVTVDKPGKVYYLAVPVNSGAEKAYYQYATSSPYYAESPGTIYATGRNYSCDIPPQRINSSGAKERVDLAEIPLGGGDTRLPVNQQKLLVDAPTANQVASRSANLADNTAGNNGSGIAFGVATLEEGEGQNLPRMTGLLPEHHYVLYLATVDGKGVWCKQPWCYQFYTEEAHLPVIITRRVNNLKAQIEVNRDVKLSYAVVPTQSLTSSESPFSKTFTSQGDNPNAKSDWVDGTSGVTTVLDAMLTSTGGMSDPSVFDKYATDETKEFYGQEIRGMQTGSGNPNSDPVLVQPEDGLNAASADSTRETTSNNQKTTWYIRSLDMPSKAMENNRYTLLVVGHSANSDETNDAFRANQAYYNDDGSYLKVNSSSKLYGTMNAEKYTGGVFISFSDSLHYKYSVGSSTYQYPLDNCPLTDSNHTATNNVSTGNFRNVGSVVSFAIIPAGVDTATLNLRTAVKDSPDKKHENKFSTLWFDASNVESGTSIIFPAGLCGSNGRDRKGLDLAFTLERITVKEAVEGRPATDPIIQWNPVTEKNEIVSPGTPEVKEQPAEYSWKLVWDPVWNTDPATR